MKEKDLLNQIHQLFEKLKKEPDITCRLQGTSRITVHPEPYRYKQNFDLLFEKVVELKSIEGSRYEHTDLHRLLCTKEKEVDHVLQADDSDPKKKKKQIIIDMNDANNHIARDISEILNDAKAICEK